MLEVRDRLILLSGKTAENFRKNALYPPVNPERDRLFAELDAMRVIERTTKKLTVERPGFNTSFLQKEQLQLEGAAQWLLISGKTAENIRENALCPPVNPERDRLWDRI